jgi:hypothetical protein
MFKLDEKHLDKAKEIALACRTRKSCNVCYERGYTGITLENTLVLCPKCVDEPKAMTMWKEYVESVPELMEHFSELFEEPKTEDVNPENKEEHLKVRHHVENKPKQKFAAGAPVRKTGTRKIGEK